MSSSTRTVLGQRSAFCDFNCNLKHKAIAALTQLRPLVRQVLPSHTRDPFTSVVYIDRTSLGSSSQKPHHEVFDVLGGAIGVVGCSSEACTARGKCDSWHPRFTAKRILPQRLVRITRALSNAMLTFPEPKSSAPGYPAPKCQSCRTRPATKTSKCRPANT